MNFTDKYNNVKENISEELSFLESEIKKTFCDKTPLNNQLMDFLSAPSKRLRPVLGYLFLNAVCDEITSEQHKILLAVELIHNATLIHDDVIDNSSKRRNQTTINAQFDDNLAVVAGDFLLSVAMEKIIETKSIEVLSIFTSALKSTCLGEINQYFSKFKVTEIDEYVQKSKEKTALLFETGILAGLILSGEKDNDKLRKSATEFSQNFGIAFQIRDDLINVLNSDDLKPKLNDLSSGIYTAPIIFAYKEDKNILEEPTLEKIKLLGGIEKTKGLMDNYFDESKIAIKDLKDSKYKSAIIELIDLLKTSL